MTSCVSVTKKILPIPAVEGSLEIRHFTTQTGFQLAYQFFPSAVFSGTLVFIPGRSEPFLKYEDVFHRLNEKNISVIAVDPRGQGFSERLLPDAMKHHVESFQDYLTDLQEFFQAVVTPQHRLWSAQATVEHFQEKQFSLSLMGHSMGGAIAAFSILDQPSVFADVDHLVLSSPMIRINSGGLPYTVAKIFINVCAFLGLSQHYFIGRGPWDWKEEETPTNLTSDFIRYGKYLDFLRKHPQALVGGPTFGWLRAAVAAEQRFASQGAALQVRSLLLQAGEDSVVDNAAQQTFCSAMKSCEIKTLPGARHEIFMEKDGIREKALGMVFGFLDR